MLIFNISLMTIIAPETHSPEDCLWMEKKCLTGEMTHMYKGKQKRRLFTHPHKSSTTVCSLGAHR